MNESVLALNIIREALLSAVASALKVRDNALQQELADALLIFSQLHCELETLRTENRQLRERAIRCEEAN